MLPPGVQLISYQRTIALAAVRQNTFAILPTGLGKSLIAFAVMANYARWYPDGKTVFLAPTRPLVTQQFRAYARMMQATGEAPACEVTAETSWPERLRAWETSQVFFTTSQLLLQELLPAPRGSGRHQRHVEPLQSAPELEVPPESPPRLRGEDIVLIVFDEAHRAQGNYAYCRVVNEVVARNYSFRVLALSASVASPALDSVMANLLIERVEIFSEDHAELRRFVHERVTEEQGVEDPPPKKGLLSRLDCVIARLNSIAREAGFLIPQRWDGWTCEGWPRTLDEAGRLEKYIYGIVLARDAPRERGLRACALRLTSCLKGDLADLPEFGPVHEFYLEVTRSPSIDNRVPVVIDAVADFLHNSMNSRVIVFASQKATAWCIADRLNEASGGVIAAPFVGRRRSGSYPGLSRRKQQQTLDRFNSGAFPVLVSTCIGEEGLDIASVDFVVCYDFSNSIVRHIQRVGRTGRARRGNVLLVERSRDKAKMRELLKQSRENAARLREELERIPPYPSPVMNPEHPLQEVVWGRPAPVPAPDGPDQWLARAAWAGAAGGKGEFQCPPGRADGLGCFASPRGMIPPFPRQRRE